MVPTHLHCYPRALKVLLRLREIEVEMVQPNFLVMAIGVEESVSWKKVVQRTTLVSEPNMAEILSIEQMQLVQSLSVVASNLLTAPGFVQIQISIPERVQT